MPRCHVKAAEHASAMFRARQALAKVVQASETKYSQRPPKIVGATHRSMILLHWHASDGWFYAYESDGAKGRHSELPYSNASIKLSIQRRGSLVPV